jgi:hypothetical protein
MSSGSLLGASSLLLGRMSPRRTIRTIFAASRTRITECAEAG